MTKITEFLEKLDLSELEAKLYLTLLESGPQTVRDLAKRAEIGRTTSYPYIDLLLEKGLILKSVKGVHTYVSVTTPGESLRHIVDQKTKQLSALKDEFPSVLESLTASMNTIDADDAEIKYYKGKLGIRKIYEEALQSNELRSTVNFETGVLFPDIEKLFIDALEKNPDFVMYELLADTPKARSIPPLHSTRYFRKFIPPKVKLSTADTLIYDGKVGIINLDGNPVGTLLNNRDYFINSKGMFDFIWDMLPSHD